MVDKPGPPPRRIRFKDGQLFEEDDHGRLWLASDDGRQEESILTKWKKMRDREINFGFDPGKEWLNGG
jgi:hypothetical protein